MDMTQPLKRTLLFLKKDLKFDVLSCDALQDLLNNLGLPSGLVQLFLKLLFTE